MTSRCLFITSSYSRVCFLIEKFRCSTLFWAVSIERVRSGCTSSSPSFIPIRSMTRAIRSEPKSRIRSSSSER